MEETQSEAIEMLSQMASRDQLVGHRPGEMQKKNVEQTFQADPGPRFERWERNGLRWHFLLLARMRTQAEESHSIDPVGLAAATRPGKVVKDWFGPFFLFSAP